MGWFVGSVAGATTVGYTIDPNDPRNANLLQQQAEGAKDCSVRGPHPTARGRRRRHGPIESSIRVTLTRKRCDAR